MGATNSVVAGASGGGKMAEMPGQMPPVKGGGGGLSDLLPQLEGIMASLKALVEKLGGGAAAAVAGASGDVAAGGPPKDAKSGASNVAGDSGPGQMTTQLPTQAPTKVAGDSGPGQFPTQAPTKVAGDSGPGKDAPGKVAGDFGPGQFPGQFPGQKAPSTVAGDFGRGVGHDLRRGRGHLRHMGPFPGQFPGQFTGQFPAPGKVAGDFGPGSKVEQAPVKAPVTQVAGDSGPGKVEQAPVKAPVTQVAGDSGPGKVEQAPTKVEQAPVKVEAPVTQVAGDSGPAKDDVPTKSEPTKSEPTQSQPTQAPAPKTPVVGDVQLLELDNLNEMQLMGADGSYLFFQGESAIYRTRSGVVRETAIPKGGFAVTLSDGSKFSLGMNEKTAWDEQAGTPRDLEIIGADGELLAARTDDGESTSWAATPMTSFNLLEVASMLFDGSYAKFGSGSGDVVQQSGSVAQK